MSNSSTRSSFPAKVIPVVITAVLGIAVVVWLNRDSGEGSSDAQEASEPAKKLSAMDFGERESAAEITARLDREIEAARLLREANAVQTNEDARVELAELEREELELRAERLQSQANARVTVLSERLQLSSEQRDQVFQILVKTSRAFDGQMSTAGDGGAAIGALPERADRATQLTTFSRGNSISERNELKLPGEDGNPSRPSDYLPIDQLTDAELAKIAETDAIQEILEPEQLLDYVTMLDEIDSYWDSVVDEVTVNLLADEAASSDLTDTPDTEEPLQIQQPPAK